MNKAKVSIGRVSSYKGDGVFKISIEDELSGNVIVIVEMNHTEFAECITGMHGCSADIKYMPTEETVATYNKVRITKRVQVNSEGAGYSREDRKALVGHDFDKNYADTWELFDDGTRSQQNKQGVHRYTIVKYVDPESDEGKKRLEARF